MEPARTSTQQSPQLAARTSETPLGAGGFAFSVGRTGGLRAIGSLVG